MKLQEDYDSVSLSDLPLVQIHNQQECESKSISVPYKQYEEFDFCTRPNESEMCAADDIFFQGQLLPTLPISVSKSTTHFTSHGYSSTSTGSSSPTWRPKKSWVWDILKLGLVVVETNSGSKKRRTRNAGISSGCKCSAALDGAIVKRSQVGSRELTPATVEVSRRRRTFEWLKQLSIDDKRSTSMVTADLN